jgi:hypothetical protein
VADLLEAREIPQVRKVTALLWFYGLHGAMLALEEDTFTVGLVHQGESAPVAAQPRELLDELAFAQATEGGEAGDFSLRERHLSRPAAAGGATLAFMKDWHARDSSGVGSAGK